MNKLHLLLLLAVTFTLSSCKEEKDDVVPGEPGLGKGFFVVNEGNFTVGNSSLSFYNYDSAKMTNNLFYQVNNVPLGDVATSMSFFRNMAFIVVNNSGIVYVVNGNTASFISSITGLRSPRHIHVVNAERAYISDIQDDRLAVFNPLTLQFIDYIELGKTSEHMLSYHNKLFVGNWSDFYQEAPNNTIQVVDVLTDQLVDSIVVTKEPNSMVFDKDNKLWVLCSGGFMGEEVPALYRINPQDHVIEQIYHFDDETSSPQQLAINGSGDTLYFLNNGVYQMTITATSLPASPLIGMGHRNFYSLAIEPSRSHVMVTDAVNYIQDGYVFRYKPDGTLIDSIGAGIIPGQIRFN